MKNIILLSLLLSISTGAKAFAQEQETDKNKAAEYFKFEISGLQTGAYGYDMGSWSFGFELENNLSRNKPAKLFSGFGLGYRREASELISRGHYLNGKVFRNFPFPLGIQPRIGAGYEWGFPSYAFDKATFLYKNNELVEYRSVYLRRNSNLPTVEASRDATGHIFGEVSLSKKAKILTFEGGVRGTKMTFGYERYRLENDKVVFHESDRNTKIVPSVFLRAGIRIP